MPFLKDTLDELNEIFLGLKIYFMKKILLFLICCATTAISFAQKETYDIISYHPPSGRTKGTEENLVSFTAVKNLFKFTAYKKL